MTRRNFLGVGAAFASLGGKTFAAAGEKPALRVGVLSDIHVCVDNGHLFNDDERRTLEMAKFFRKALEWYRERGVDAVAIAGDLANFGLVSELKIVADVWRSVFPNDRGADGQPVAKAFVYGNHDAVAWRWQSGWTGREWQGAERKAKWQDAIARDYAGAWESCFGGEWAPIMTARAKGYTFVCGNWRKVGTEPDERKYFGRGTDVPGVEDWFKAHASELRGDRPFFYLQHLHPKGTCLPFASYDGGAATRALSAFPNAVAFSGDSHQPLTDERNMWKGAFISMGAASMLDMGGRNWRANGAPYANGITPMAHMPCVKLACSHGQYMKVYADRLEVERRDFIYDMQVGPDWVIPFGAGRSWDFAARAAAMPLPQFRVGAKAEVTFVDGKTDAGLPMRRAVVCIPPADAGGRVYEYEVRAILLADDYELPAAGRRVLAPDFHLPLAKAHLPGEAWFPLCELPPKAKMRFEVRPVDCFGRLGEPICAEAQA